MKRIFLAAALLGFFTANAQVLVKVKPPKPKVVIHKPVKHKKGFVWVVGHWEWSKRKQLYVWKKAHWKRARRGFHWSAGYWKVTTKGFVWVAGRWKRR